MAFGFDNVTLDAFNSDLVLAWRLEDANITDDSGQGNDGSNVGTDDATGKNNQCRDWIATNQDRISDTDFAGISGSVYTIAFWMFDESATQAIRRWWTTTIGGLGSTDIIFREEGSGSNYIVRLFAHNIGGTVTISSWKSAWTLWVVRADGSNVKVYKDGNLTPIINLSASGTPATGFYFGGFFSVGPKEFYEGRNDELYIWNTDISDAAITALYNGGIGRFWHDLVVFVPQVIMI